MQQLLKVAALLLMCLLSSHIGAQHNLAYWDSLYHSALVQTKPERQLQLLEAFAHWAKQREEAVGLALVTYMEADQLLGDNAIKSAIAKWNEVEGFCQQENTTRSAQVLAIRNKFLGARLAQAQGQVNLAIFRYKQGQELASGVAPQLLLLGCIQQAELLLQQGLYKNAYEALEQAQEILQSKPELSNTLEMRVERLRGELLAAVGLDTLAVETLHRVQFRAATLQDTGQLINTILALAPIQLENGDLSSAQSSYEKANEQAVVYGDNALLAQCLLGLGTIAYVQKDTLSAHSYYLEAYQLAERFNLITVLGQAAVKLGQLAVDQGQVETANIYCSQAYELANSRRILSVQRNACHCLQAVHGNRKEWDVAYHLLEEYQRLDREETEGQVARAIAAQKFQRKLSDLHQLQAAERHALKSEKEETQANLTTQQRRSSQLISLLMGVLAFTAIVYWLFHKNKQKNQALSRLNRELSFSNRQLAQANEQLEENNLALNRFAAVAAHDLKGPLRSIQSFSELLHKKLAGRINGQEQRFFEFISTSTGRLGKLIDDLLRFSSLGSQMNEAEPVSLQQVMQIITAGLQKDITQKNAIIEYANLPTVLAKETLMVPLFQNLISNSLKFVRDEVRPKIVIKGEIVNDQRARVEVIDNGIGIPKDQQEKVFELFSRLHSNDDYEGSGVGLATCRKIIQHYNGAMGIESAEGQGTTVWVELPMA